MSYRIEWIIAKEPTAKESQDFYGYYDEYQNEFGEFSFETYKRYCRSAVAQIKLGAVQQLVSDNENEEETDDTEIKTYRRDNDKNELYIEAHSFSLRTIDDLISYAEIDTDKWECFKQVANKWGSFSNDCYQIKGWFRLKDTSKISPEDYAKRFQELVKNYAPKTHHHKYEDKDDKILAEIALFDFHFGQLIWGEASGTQNYDSDIAGKMFDRTVDYFINETKDQVSKYLLPLGNDFFNSDTVFNTTTKGTPQFEDGYWKKTFIKAEELFIRNIDKFAEVAPVDILIVPGNHDTQRIFFMGQFLEAWYRDNLDVNIIISHKPRQYYVWGKNLIGFTHGQNEIKGSLPMLMCQEAPLLFADTKYHEWHTGHFHSYSEKKVRLANDHFGIREIILPTMIPVAEYAALRGYMQINEAMCFLWDTERGKISTLYYH